MSNLQVAETILEQLGGRRFTAMTGARNFLGDKDSLSFRLPSNFAKDGINCVRIVLNWKDLYDVTFSRIRGSKTTPVSEMNDVDAENLAEIFRSATGLEVRL